MMSRRGITLELIMTKKTPISVLTTREMVVPSVVSVTKQRVKNKNPHIEISLCGDFSYFCRW